MGNNVVETAKSVFKFDAQNAKVQKFFKQSRNNFLMRLYQLKSVPGAFWFRLKVEKMDENEATVSIPLSWRTRNPFGSIYFVGQMAAAEYSTALFVYSRILLADNVKFIVKEAKAEFVGRTSGRTYFTCDDPDMIDSAIQKAIETGEQQTVLLPSTGRLKSGEIVSKVWITWTFKHKKR